MKYSLTVKFCMNLLSATSVEFLLHRKGILLSCEKRRSIFALQTAQRKLDNGFAVQFNRNWLPLIQSVKKIQKTIEDIKPLNTYCLESF